MINVLLIEDNPADVRLIQEYVASVKGSSLNLLTASRLSEGMEIFSSSKVDAILLDLSLPDSKGMETFFKVRLEQPTVPILLLTGLSDEELAIQAVREGAQDYLVKGQVDGSLLVRAVNYAIERQRLLAQLEDARRAAHQLTLMDDLTGLYNRRGFYTLSKQQWKLADRRKKKLVLIYCDLDNLKEINDQLGHKMGDQALVIVAQALRSTFRESDIIARMGGDEFATLAIEAESDGRTMIRRLDEQIERINSLGEFQHKLSVSSGVAHYDPENPVSIDEVLAQADAQMYTHKYHKKVDTARDGPKTPSH